MNMSFKGKFILFVAMVGFMVLYGVFFGNKNAVIGMMIVMASLMNLGNDLSYKTKLSFIKVLTLLLILGIASFLNTPLTIWACILTFIVVFGTTFSSYHLFGNHVYMPFLMTYFMMMCIPVTLEELPVRLLSLVVGAIFFVGLNIIVNKKKDYKLSKQTIEKLTGEIVKACDVKLDGGEVSLDSFKTANGFYSALFNKFEYNYFPSVNHESVLNVIKAFQYVGYVISKFNLTDDELKYIKHAVQDFNNIDLKNVKIETNEMALVLLNLEIIAFEIKNRNWEKVNTIPNSQSIKTLFKPVLKRYFSFKSPKFTFAFKMAIILMLWEILTLIFNLPYTKWLYFATIPLMQPYIDDVAYNAKSRVTGTIIGALIFTILFVIAPFLPISTNILIVIVMLVCIFGLVNNVENKLNLTIFTTVISIMVSLMYIPVTLAVPLKIIWVVVAVIIVSLVNFKFLPYSVKKETRINLEICYNLNSQSIELVKQRCNDIKSYKKTTVLVLSNIVGQNIEITDENNEVYYTQKRITDGCNFILNYLDIEDVSQKLKLNLLDIINKGGSIDESLNLKDSVIAYSMKYVMDLFKKEEKLLWHN